MGWHNWHLGLLVVVNGHLGPMAYQRAAETSSFACWLET